jgi:hypothetical protein
MVGGGTFTVSVTDTICGLFVALGSVKVIVALYVPTPKAAVL